MIKYLHHNEIDKDKWDACLKESFNGLVYANSWFLDIVGDEWEALVENDYERVFPLISRKKWGINYLFQPVFTQQLGVFSKSLLSQEVVSSFLEQIPGKFKFIELNLNTFNKAKSWKYKIEDWNNFELDLIESYVKIAKGYSTNLKRNLKKAQKENLSVSKNLKPEEIVKMFRENRGRQIRNLDEDDYLKLRRLAYQGIYKGLIQTYGVYTEKNELCAGAFFTRSNKKMIFQFSGLTQEGRETNAMAFLIDSFIREHAQNHLTLDFEGSNDPNLARFYKSFGSVNCTYHHIVINRLPLFIKPIFFLYKWMN